MSRKDGKTDDLRNMLMSFRIAELRTLLTSCSRPSTGRKHELLGRAVNLLKSADNPGLRERVKSKILELYHQRYPPATGSLSNVNSMSQYKQSYMPYPSEKDEPPTYLNRPSHYGKHIPQQRNSGYRSMHDSQMHSLYHPVGGVPFHPDVRFIALPFYDIVDVLTKPTSLVQKTLTGYQEIPINFSFSPYQTQLITNSRSYNIKSMIEYAVQVQLRFCLAETSCVQEDLYPPRCKVAVNGKGCPLPGQPPPNAQNQEPRKPHRPVNITHLCRLSPMQSNQINIQWMPSDIGQRYAVTVHLVKAVPTSTLIRKLEEKPERSCDHTISFIKEKLRQDPDSEIALTSLKVSLCCPISRTKMKMPCRANNCNHLQCFDGETYIRLNERKPSWVCPVCDQKAHYNQLFKDGMFTNIIYKSPHCDDIVFFEDGSWRPLSDVQDPSKPLSQIVTPNMKEKAPIVDCKTPPPLSTNTPPLTTVASHRMNPNDPPPLMPKLEKAPPYQSQDTEDEVEVITIDDSDSDDGDDESPVNLPYQSRNSPTSIPSMTNISPHCSFNYPSVDQTQQTSSLPFSDPDLQGLDLYNLLPHEDRIAAAMYLDQAGILGQLTNTRSRSSPSSIIDISDE